MMPDKAKVMTGLECIIQQAQNGTCGPCAYFRPFTDDPDCGWCDKVAIENDALVLLKEQDKQIDDLKAELAKTEDNFSEYVEMMQEKQEPVEPTWRLGLAFCGKCGRQFGRGFKYCPDCGRNVKWE